MAITTKKPSSGRTCAVIGCLNSQKRLNEWLDRECYDHRPATKRNCTCGPLFSFFKKPKDDYKSRMWLKALNLKKPPKNVFVCSFHFVEKKPTEENPFPELWMGHNRSPRRRCSFEKRTPSSPHRKRSRLQSGEMSLDHLSPDFVPSIFPCSKQQHTEEKMNRYQRQKKQTERFGVALPSQPSAPGTEDGGQLGDITSMVDSCAEDIITEADYNSLNMKYTQLKKDHVNLLEESQQLRDENKRLKEELKNSRLSYPLMLFRHVTPATPGKPWMQTA